MTPFAFFASLQTALGQVVDIGVIRLGLSRE